MPNELTKVGIKFDTRAPVALRSVDRKIDITEVVAFLPPEGENEERERLHGTVELLNNQPRDTSMKVIDTNKEGDGIAEPRSVGEKGRKGCSTQFIS